MKTVSTKNLAVIGGSTALLAVASLLLTHSPGPITIALDGTLLILDAVIAVVIFGRSKKS